MRAEEKVLYAYYRQKTDSLYFNELVKLTGLSHSSLQNAIKKLDLKKVAGRAVTEYQLKTIPFSEFSRFDHQRLNSLDIQVQVPLKKLLKILPFQIAFIILFGSISRGEQIKKSDIDMLIVLHKFDDHNLQRKYEDHIRKKIDSAKNAVEKVSLHPFNIFITDMDGYQRREDHLVEQAKKTGFAIAGNETYYRTGAWK